MKQADFLSGIALTVFCLAMLFFVIPAQIEPAPDGYLSPRLVPNIAMIVIAGLSVLLTLKSLGKSETLEPQAAVFSRSEMRAFFGIAGVFAISLALFALASPLLAGIALIAGTLVLLGERRPLILFLMPAGLLLAVWGLFYKLLGNPIV